MPIGKLVVVNVAFPPINTPVPNTADPFLKVTLPIGLAVGESTVTLRVTACPKPALGALETRLVVVVALATVIASGLTTSRKKLVSPK